MLKDTFTLFKASTPSMVEAKFLHDNVAAYEDDGQLTVPIERSGNVFLASVLT